VAVVVVVVVVMMCARECVACGAFSVLPLLAPKQKRRERSPVLLPRVQASHCELRRRKTEKNPNPLLQREEQVELAGSPSHTHPGVQACTSSRRSKDARWVQLSSSSDSLPTRPSAWLPSFLLNKKKKKKKNKCLSCRQLSCLLVRREDGKTVGLLCCVVLC